MQTGSLTKKDFDIRNYANELLHPFCFDGIEELSQLSWQLSKDIK